MRADPKPARRIKASAHRMKQIRNAKRGPCRGCGRRNEYPGISFHHVVPRSLGGDDVEANVIPLCGDGTRGCHGLFESRGVGFSDLVARLRESFTPEEIEYAVSKKSAEWLDRYYPKGDE